MGDTSIPKPGADAPAPPTPEPPTAPPPGAPAAPPRSERHSATVGINEVTEFDQIDVPDFSGPLHSRLELYGTTDAVRPRNLYEAQRELTR